MSLEQRVEELERQNRRAKQIGAIGAAVIAALLLVGQGGKNDKDDVSRHLRARSLTLVDKNGDTWLYAGLTGGDDHSLELYPPKGTGKVSLYAHKKGGGVGLLVFDRKENPTVALGLAQTTRHKSGSVRKPEALEWVSRVTVGQRSRCTDPWQQCVS